MLLTASEEKRAGDGDHVSDTCLAPSSSLHITLLRVSGLPGGADGNTPVFTEMDHTVDWGNSETLILTLVYKQEI